MKTKKIEARLIGESSAGMTAVEIYEDDKLVWSHDYFSDGASENYYNRVTTKLIQEDMESCKNWAEYDGCSVDNNGNPVLYDNCDTTGIVATYRPDAGWEYGDDDYGQTGDVVINGRKISDIISPE